MKKTVLIILAIATTFAACVEEDFVERETNSSGRLSILRANDNDSSTDSLFVGDTLTLEAIFFNATGEEEFVEFVWESSNPEFAEIEETNKLIGKSEGVTTVSVSYDTLIERKMVLVQAVERIELSVPNTSLQPGETITPVGKYYNDQGVESNATFSFTSSNTDVAAFNSSNELEALQAGQTIISASFNGVTSNSISITVVNDLVSVALVEITPTSSTILEGESAQFSAVARNINGDALPDAPITWNSTNPSVLSINAEGLGTGNAVGSSDVTASSGDAMSSTSSVIVNPFVLTTRSGNFFGVRGYRVTGTVTMSTLPSGSLQLSLEGFSSSRGPGLYVYLSNTTSGGIPVEALNSRSGNFTVDLPPNVSISDYNYILIWCQPFGVTFGAARLN